MALPPLSRAFDKFPSEANGCWELARHYDAGVGTVKDPYLAAYWARVAAQRGAAAAASWLRLKQLEREVADVDARRKVQKALAQDNAL